MRPTHPFGYLTVGTQIWPPIGVCRLRKYEERDAAYCGNRFGREVEAMEGVDPVQPYPSAHEGQWRL